MPQMTNRWNWPCNQKEQPLWYRSFR